MFLIDPMSRSPHSLMKRCEGNIGSQDHNLGMASCSGGVGPKSIDVSDASLAERRRFPKVGTTLAIATRSTLYNGDGFVCQPIPREEFRSPTSIDHHRERDLVVDRGNSLYMASPINRFIPESGLMPKARSTCPMDDDDVFDAVGGRSSSKSFLGEESKSRSSRKSFPLKRMQDLAFKSLNSRNEAMLLENVVHFDGKLDIELTAQNHHFGH